MDIARQHNPIAGSILDAISKGGEDHGSLPAWVRNFTTPVGATQLAAVFSRIFSMTYMSHPWKEGLSCAPLWMLSDASEAGFSLPTDDEIFCVISLMLVQTIRTDPSIPGVEAISLRELPVDLANPAATTFDPIRDTTPAHHRVARSLVRSIS